jgi:hypothetical protein
MLQAAIIGSLPQAYLVRPGPGHDVRPSSWRIPVSKAVVAVAVAAAVTAGAGSAFAGGLPYGSVPPVYAPQAFPNEPYHTGTVFSEIYHGVFGHPNNDSAVANKAGDTPSQAKGG